jgi:hypothetical protein
LTVDGAGNTVTVTAGSTGAGFFSLPHDVVLTPGKTLAVIYDGASWRRLSDPGLIDGPVGINGMATSPLAVYGGTNAGRNTDGLSHAVVYANGGTTADSSFVLKTHGISNGVAGALKFQSSPDAVNYNWGGIKALTNGNVAVTSLAFYTAPSNTSAESSTEVMRLTGPLTTGPVFSSAGTLTSTNPTTVPARANSPCTPSQWAADTSYVYICVAANTWRRAPLASW